MKERVRKMLSECRDNARLTQQDVASRLHMSRNTVINWEEGKTVPDFVQLLHWFHACNEPIYPYLLKVLHPEKFQRYPHKDDDVRIQNALITCITDLPMDDQKRLLLLLTGGHGSNPHAVLNMINAYLQSTIHSRLNVATIILNNYKITNTEGNIVQPHMIQPDTDKLELSINQGKAMILNRRH